MKLKLLGLDIPDSPTKEEMVAYLDSHFTYDTMNSFNQVRSFAQCIKIHSLDASSDEKDMMFEMLGIEDPYDSIRYILKDFDANHGYEFQIGSNGRSGGYLVLYMGGIKPSEYKSFCPHCGQQNYRNVGDPKPYRTSEGNACGACGRERVDYKEPPMQVYTQMGVGFSDKWMELDEEERLEQAEYFFGVVADFDRTCEEYCMAFLDFARDHVAEEQEILVPKKIIVAVPRQKE